MLIIETGILWRRVAKRFEARVNEATKLGTWKFKRIAFDHKWLGLRVIFLAELESE